jgi:uncharacterized membrane protein
MDKWTEERRWWCFTSMLVLLEEGDEWIGVLFLKLTIFTSGRLVILIPEGAMVTSHALRQSTVFRSVVSMDLLAPYTPSISCLKSSVLQDPQG